MKKTRTASLLVLFLLLCVPGSAHAERNPTPREKAGIERAARKAYADHYFKVRVSRLEVSTVERQWATAVVATFHRDERHAPVAQRMQETFYRTGKGWVAWFSVAWPDKEMPIEVERDLGFAGPAPLFGISGEAAFWIVIGVIVLIFIGFIAWNSDPRGPEDEYVILRFRRPR